MDNRYLNYYKAQVGGGVADFGPIFHARSQRGRGLGSIFSGLLRYLKPVFFSGLNAIKNEAIRTGSDILQNLGTAPLSKLIRDKGLEGVQNLTDKAMNKIKQMSGSGRKLMSSCSGKQKKPIKGGGKSKNHQYKRKSARGGVKKRLLSIVGRKKPKRNNKKKQLRVLDIFGGN